jgi:ribosome biogenesis protein Nip4
LGESIVEESIVENTEIIVENQLLIILNLHREAIGIGMTKYHAKYLPQRGIATVTTLIDAGIYLRNEERRRGNL